MNGGLVVDRHEAGGIRWESARRPPDHRLVGLVAEHNTWSFGTFKP